MRAGENIDISGKGSENIENDIYMWKIDACYVLCAPIRIILTEVSILGTKYNANTGKINPAQNK